MLRRVIALLVAFAVLAERVADRSALVRCFVLWILRRAEVAAGEFFLEQAGMSPAPGGIAVAGYGPAYAFHLAARFRALAAALCALLPVGYPIGRRPARCFASCHAAQGSNGLPDDWTRKPFDTS